MSEHPKFPLKSMDAEASSSTSIRRLLIIGASGKMGQQLIALGSKEPSWVIAGSASRPCEFDALPSADLLMDFSHASLLLELLKYAKQRALRLVIGTTGYSIEELSAIEDASNHIPIFYAANYSIGIAALLYILRPFTEVLPENFSMTIQERHHLNKKDSPSGTALALANAAQRQNTIHSIREGAVIGEHTILFAGPNESISIQHTAHDRALFAQGALLAAKFLLKQSPGLYTMGDLLCDKLK